MFWALAHIPTSTPRGYWAGIQPELTMPEPSNFLPVAKYSAGTKFADMTPYKKLVFVVQLVICIGTFGFVYPNVQSS